MRREALLRGTETYFDAQEARSASFIVDYGKAMERNHLLMKVLIFITLFAYSIVLWSFAAWVWLIDMKHNLGVFFIHSGSQRMHQRVETRCLWSGHPKICDSEGECHLCVDSDPSLVRFWTEVACPLSCRITIGPWCAMCSLFGTRSWRSMRSDVVSRTPAGHRLQKTSVFCIWEMFLVKTFQPIQLRLPRRIDLQGVLSIVEFDSLILLCELTIVQYLATSSVAFHLMFLTIMLPD